jgi:hypothetical protein
MMMNKQDWDKLHVGATIHLQKGNFYVSTVHTLGYETNSYDSGFVQTGIGAVWDRQGFKLQFGATLVEDATFSPNPWAHPVINGRVIFPGMDEWPEITQYLFKGERGNHEYTQEELNAGLAKALAKQLLGKENDNG